ncbi:MAG TPA: AAA family ATPase, partial [Polyangium sp.]|nr:AAA family ATPase [Polyangium sp.]
QYFSARREPEALGETPSPQGGRSEREARRLAELKRKLISAYYRSLRSKKRLDTEIPVFERLQRFIRPFLGDDWTIDVLPTDNDPGSGDEVILRRGEVPSDITSLAMARNEALLRDDIPPLVPMDRLSSGQIALFAFAGPLVFRDAPADVVLIDEPEQHLHVQWQRYIIPALRELSPESQFIVATHSLDVADAASHDERLLLLPEGDPRLSRSKKDLAAE